MELLYFWIDQSDNNVLKKQEVLLSSKYNIKFDSDNLKVEISKNESFYNIFENDVVKSVSALVGSNGVGKTTLLKYLYNNDIIPKIEESRDEYKISREHRYLNYKTLQIFEQDKKIIVMHNLEQDVNSTEGIGIIKMTSQKFREMDENKSYLSSITKIYLTNGNYLDQDGYSSNKGDTSKVVLSPKSLRVLSNKFYEKNVVLTNMILEKSKYNILQKIIISEKTEMDFQSICDIIYFNYLFKEKQIEQFFGKIAMEFDIYSVVLPSILLMTKEYKYRLEDMDKLWKTIINKTQCDSYDLINRLKLNLILELDFIYGSDYISSILDENSKKINLDDICSSYIYTLELVPENEFDEVKEYYINAKKEIDELEKIIENSNSVSNNLPKGDLAYKENIIISYEKDKKGYLGFIKYIDKIAKKDKSFILKYIKIGNLKMSSGERAYLNFFSWLNLLTFFNKIDQSVIKSTRKNILLLIDEIELYCHPEWQRKFIDFLLEELNLQFKDKNIQIIFATHSPIVLSDIPLSNTIYISKDKNGNSVIENRLHHKETFGANIYRLFNDSFFLENEGVIGEYAKKKINQVFLDLKKVIESEKEKNDLRKDEIKFIIDSIGEPVIKNKLEEMYMKVFLDDKVDLIDTQRKQITELKERIIKGKIFKEEELKNLSTQLQDALKEINKLIDTKGDLK